MAAPNAAIVAPPSGALGNWNQIMTTGHSTNPGLYATAVVESDGRAYVVGGSLQPTKTFHFGDVASVPIGLTSGSTLNTSFSDHATVTARFAGGTPGPLYTVHILDSSYVTQNGQTFSASAATTAAWPASAAARRAVTAFQPTRCTASTAAPRASCGASRRTRPRRAMPPPPVTVPKPA